MDGSVRCGGALNGPLFPARREIKSRKCRSSRWYASTVLPALPLSDPMNSLSSALGILIFALLYFRCEFLAVIWAFIPRPVAFCPLNSPQQVCSGTSFLLRDALLPERNRRLQRKRSGHPAFSYGEHGNRS